MARQQPALFGALIDLLSDAVVRYLSAQITAGAEVLQLFDSWAGVLPEPELRRWCFEPTQRIVSALRARHPDVPVIAFPRGIGASYEAFAREVPVQGISLDTTVPVAWAAQSLRREPSLCLQGNLDPVALLGDGSSLVAEAATDRVRLWRSAVHFQSWTRCDAGDAARIGCPARRLLEIARRMSH